MLGCCALVMDEDVGEGRRGVADIGLPGELMQDRADQPVDRGGLVFLVNHAVLVHHILPGVDRAVVALVVNDQKGKVGHILRPVSGSVSLATRLRIHCSRRSRTRTGCSAAIARQDF